MHRSLLKKEPYTKVSFEKIDVYIGSVGKRDPSMVLFWEHIPMSSLCNSLLKQGPGQKHAIVKGGVARRTSPGSHHGNHEVSPEHVKGDDATTIVFPTAGGHFTSGTGSQKLFL